MVSKFLTLRKRESPVSTCGDAEFYPEQFNNHLVTRGGIDMFNVFLKKQHGVS